MTGRYRENDLHDEVVHGIREIMDHVSPNSWLVAENADMIARDLDGSGWHGTMNYQGFARPLWAGLITIPK
jgi:alpha-glucosidase